MMNVAVRRTALVALVVLASACADSVTLTGPTATTPSPRTPGLSRPAQIYVFARGLSYPVSEWTSDSRYVLYDDDTFALQFLLSQGSFQYRGTYTKANTLITFHWQDNQNVPAPWRPSSGTLTDDSLAVQYDVIMNLDGFEDAVYVRTQ